MEEITTQKIKNLIPSGVLNKYTRLVLVNGIYFHGRWKHKFDTKSTKEELFNVIEPADNKKSTKAIGTVPVQMMQQTEKIPLCYIPKLDAKAVQMNYVGEQISMILILPNKEDDDLSRIEEGLTKVSFRDCFVKGHDAFKQQVMLTHKIEKS